MKNIKRPVRKSLLFIPILLLILVSFANTSSADDSISDRKAERIASDIMRYWSNERWGNIYSKGTMKSQSMYTKDGFNRALKTATYRVRNYRIKSIDNRSSAGSFDAYVDVVFKCRSGFSCPEQKKLVELSFYQKGSEWGVWLADVIYGMP